MRAILVLAIGLMISGCAQQIVTNVNGFVDPKYREYIKFDSVAVMALGGSLEQAQAIEDTAVKEFSERGVRALRSLDLVPPTRKLTGESWSKAIHESKVEAMLYIKLKDLDLTERYIPPRYHPGRLSATSTDYGSYTEIIVRQSPGHVSGGYTISEPTATYSLTLQAAHRGETAWIANAHSYGYAKHRFIDLARSVTVKSVEQLFAEDLFWPQHGS